MASTGEAKRSQTLSTKIRINYKGWVLEATALQDACDVPTYNYIIKYRATGLAADVFRKALIKHTDFTYLEYMKLPEWEQKKIVVAWLDASTNPWTAEEPDIVY
jgi:hypothetical protein